MRLESGNGRLAVLQTAVPDLSTAAELRTWFAQQYAAGTPVMLYYPLETETTEDWTETSYCETPIKIATTKYNETAFSPLNTALQNAISVVDTVVSNTITQAASIATLQAQKQTRPNDIADDNEKCPAGKKCLLVEDASGVPHWYEIVENAWDLPVGYTQLQWIESTGTQYIDTGIKPNDVDYIIADFQYTNTELIPSAIIAAASNSIYNYFGEHTAFRGFGENWGNASTWKTFDIAHNTNRHIWKADLSNSSEGIVKFYLDENLVTTQTGAQNSDANFTISSLAFASLRSTQGKYYSVKFEKNNALIRDFVPAKNPDGKIGMYDKVNGVFYENQGTGEFVAGDPVSE
ncbi:MAG: hypothetical protein IKL95_03520 [Alphaproteobacteria bacterium]|nr:hypothetical protein [Alphaproteobacteria bacterium]